MKRILLNQTRTSKRILCSHVQGTARLRPVNRIPLTWYIGFSKNLICCYHLWSKPISAKQVLSLPLVSQTGGITVSEIGYYGPIFLAKFGRFYRWYMVAASNNNFFNPLPRVWSKHFCLKYLCQILWLIMWNNAHFAWWWNVIFLAKIQ